MEKYKNKMIGVTIIGIVLKVESLPLASIVLLIGLLGLSVYYLRK
jgi:hypothetical protein